MNREYKTYQVQNIVGDKAKHYKKKELEFDYLPKKEFKKLKKNNNEINVIGSIKLKTTNKTKTDIVIIDSNDRIYQYELFNNEDSSNKEKNQFNVMGYLKIDDNTYVSIIKNKFLFLILFLFLLILGILMFRFISFIPGNEENSSISTESKNPLEFEEGEDWNGENPQNHEKIEQESIKIPGYANLYVSSNNPEIRLINPDDNTVYMVYKIINEGETILETKAIKPGQMISANLKELLDVGKYELIFEINTYDIENEASCNGATQNVKLLVKE